MSAGCKLHKEAEGEEVGGGGGDLHTEAPPCERKRSHSSLLWPFAGSSRFIHNKNQENHTGDFFFFSTCVYFIMKLFNASAHRAKQTGGLAEVSEDGG